MRDLEKIRNYFTSESGNPETANRLLAGILDSSEER